jgi:hypothetical protein
VCPLRRKDRAGELRKVLRPAPVLGLNTDTNAAPAAGKVGVVRSIWKRERDDLEQRLRAERPEASAGLVAELVERSTPAVPVRRWSRVAFAGAMTVFMLGFFASFGGLGYAAANVHSATRTVTRIVVPAKHTKVVVRHTQSAGEDQYGHQQYTPPAAKPKVIQVAGISTAPAPTSTSNELPFTGFGLGLTAGIGLVLLALGMLLRRRESGAQ